MAYTEDPALHRALPAGDLYPVLPEHEANERLAVDPIGHPCRRDGRVHVLVRPEEPEAHALYPGARGTPQKDVALEDFFDTLGQDLLQRDVELDDDAYRRRPRCLGRGLGIGLLRRRPVEVEAWHPALRVRPHRPLADAHEAQPWGRHQRLLGPRDHHINAPLVSSQGAGSEPGDRIYDRDHILGSAGETLDVIHRTGGGLGEDAHGSLDPGFPGE